MTKRPKKQPSIDNAGDQRVIEAQRHINEADTRPLGGLPKSSPFPLKEESFLFSIIVTVRNDKVIEATKAHSLMLDSLNDMRKKGEIVRYQTSVTQVINRGQDVS